MATEILTKSYQGADLSGATPGVIYLPISYDSTILAIKVKTDLNVAGDAEFVLTNLDGTTIAGTALTIESGTRKAVLTGLEIARLEDADVLLKLTSGAVSSPITLVLVVSDDTYSDTTPALSDLIDVEIVDPQSGDALVFDETGEVWRNQPVSTGDGTGDNPELSLTTFREVCDFMAGDVGDPQIANVNKWSGSPSGFTPANNSNFNNIDGNHVGIHRNGVNTADPAFLMLGGAYNPNPVKVIHSESMFDMTFIAKLSDASASSGYRLGLCENPSNRTFGNGYFLISDPDEAANIKGCQRLSGTDTKTASLKTLIADTWYKFRVRRVSSTQIGFQINDETEVVLTVTAINLPLVPMVQVWSNTGSFYYFSVDYAEIIVTGLDRY